jgi:hypothetical protein
VVSTKEASEARRETLRTGGKDFTLGISATEALGRRESADGTFTPKLLKIVSVYG